MIRATIDTSVLVSALNFGGVPEEILKALEAGAFLLCISPSIIGETRRVLLERFDWTEDDLAEALDPLVSLAEIVEPSSSVTVSRDPNDDHVLACALDSRADFIALASRLCKCSARQ